MGLKRTGLPQHVQQLGKLLEVGQGRLFETRNLGKAASSRQRGKTANRTGKSFQKIIAASSGRGNVIVMELPKCGGFFIGPKQFIHQKIPCDFIGSIRSPRAALFFDAKSFGASQRSFPVNDAKLVKPHQHLFLRTMAEWGAVAGFLVEVRRRRQYLWLSAAGLERNAPVEWSDVRWVVVGRTGELVNLDLLADLFGGRYE